MIDPPPVPNGTRETPARGALRAAFIARLTASATHELRNVLAIVKESAGLVADLVAVAGPGGPSAEKTGWALERIQRQVARGADLSTSLNRIMHGLDQDQESVPLPDALRHAARLTVRFAHQRGRGIEVEECASTPTVRANALDLYMTLVAVMESCIERIPEGAALVARAEERGERAAVAFHAAPPAADIAELAASPPPSLRDELAGVSGNLEAGPEGVLLLVFGRTEEAQ